MKKLAAVLVALLLTIGCLPVSAFAEGGSAKIVGCVDHERTLTIRPVTNGHVTVLAPDPLHDGDTVVFTMTPDAGYVLSAVFVNGADVTKGVVDNTYTMTVAGDIEFYAVFEGRDSGKCVYVRPVCLVKNGTYGMRLGCCNKGEFTFTRNGCGWSIKNADGKYLAMQDGRMKLSAVPFVWAYTYGTFSATVKITVKTCGYWLGWIYIPGSTQTVTTTYYLSTVRDGEMLSVYPVCAELYETVSGEHCFGCCTDCRNGTHKHICMNCGKVEIEAHSFNETTHRCVCGAFDPKPCGVTVKVIPCQQTQKQYVGFWPFGYYMTFTTYTYTIKTETVGVKVCKVEYKLCGRWYCGSVLTSNTKLDQLEIRVTDSVGLKHTYTYNGTTVIEK